MPLYGTRRGVIALLVLLLLTVQITASAEQTAGPVKERPPEPVDSAGLMLADALLLRPLGLAATLLGTATFVLTLPFSLPTRSAAKAAKALVLTPAEYTFARPLGEVKP